MGVGNTLEDSSRGLRFLLEFLIGLLSALFTSGGETPTPRGFEGTDCYCIIDSQPA
jgi:hypothetical protein